MKHTNNLDIVRLNKIFIILLVLILLSEGALSIGLGTFEKGIEYTPDVLTSVEYYVVNRPPEDTSFNLKINGTLEPYITVSMPSEHYWYSTSETEFYASLERDFDLRNVNSATLEFLTRYHIEDGWDFGYIEVSTDNGFNWTQLNGTDTTFFRCDGSVAPPPCWGGTAGVGIPGAPAYTGIDMTWKTQTVNLTPYAGNITRIRFSYYSDEYYARNGWWIDDIEIPEIGFSDDVESGENNWTSGRWAIITPISSSEQLRKFNIDLLMPDSYSPTSSSQTTITVKEVSSAGGYSTTPAVRMTLPALTKVEKPPTQPPSEPISYTGGGRPVLQAIPVYSCGDGDCDLTETCDRCPEDCGACPVRVEEIPEREDLEEGIYVKFGEEKAEEIANITEERPEEIVEEEKEVVKEGRFTLWILLLLLIIIILLIKWIYKKKKNKIRKFFDRLVDKIRILIKK